MGPIPRGLIKICGGCTGESGPEPEPVPAEVKHGLLYNWYAATDAREITSIGWHIPTRQKFYDLMIFADNDGLPNNNTAGIELKDIDYWELPNVGINSLGFNARGSGRRVTGGVFALLLKSISYYTITEQTSNPNNVHLATLYSTSYGLPWINTMNIGDNDDYIHDVALKNIGASIRPLKNSTTLSHGESGTYTDPSGITYRTICIGTQEWVADNIGTRHYRNGDPIPEVTNAGDWVALVTGALCAYNNDWNNV